MKKLKEIYLSTYFLIELNPIKKYSAIKAFLELLKTFCDTNDNDLEKHLKVYSIFLTELKKTKYDNFSGYLKDCICKETPKINIKNIQGELEIIENLSKISHKHLKQILIKKFPKNSDLIEKLPNFKNSQINPSELKQHNLKTDIDAFENFRAFIFDNDFEIKPVKFNDNTTFKDLKEYKEQKRILYENTKALLNSAKVNNILLYGDAGCGKSSSVRALLNEFEDLKMVQIFKNNLINLDKLYEKLSMSAHKFIIFADDISFDDTDNTFSTMKAIIEGSLIQCPKNAAIYATSNRRHLVKESFQSRKGDEIHLNDTLNEITSLSERFGINLLFQKPTNEEYIRIVTKLAHDNKIKMDDKILIEKAQKMALIKGSKSPRTARQLIDNILANINI